MLPFIDKQIVDNQIVDNQIVDDQIVDDQIADKQIVDKQSFNKQAVADSFSKAASHYDQFAQLQRDIGAQLLNNMRLLDKPSPIEIIDLGCGTGYFSEKLATQYRHGKLTCFDLSDAMLAQVKKRNINNASVQQGDIDALPFSKNSVDVIYSNLVVQWSDDLASCLTQIKHSLKTGGQAYISTLLNGTLNELTQAWKSVDDNRHTNEFLDLTRIESILSLLGFSQVVVSTETRTLHYQNVIEVMRALKGIGANHVHLHKNVALSGRKLIQQLEAGYLPYQNEKGLLKLTYQVCYIEITK
ncbi:MAG: malonyl-ACP O-methyltransferase BioC [Psychromonas sp.]